MHSIHTDNAPAAIGTYSQAIRWDNIVFLSGQIPLNPQTMELCSDKIEQQITQVFDNLTAVCKASGGNLTQIVKLNVYLTNLTHFPLINEAMRRYFTTPFPARAVIEVSGLPRGSQVEIDGIMVLCNS